MPINLFTVSLILLWLLLTLTFNCRERKNCQIILILMGRFFLNFAVLSAVQIGVSHWLSHRRCCSPSSRSVRTQKPANGRRVSTCGKIGSGKKSRINCSLVPTIGEKNSFDRFARKKKLLHAHCAAASLILHKQMAS